MEYTEQEWHAIIAGLNAIDPHNVFIAQLKQKAVASMKAAADKEKKDK